MAAKKEHQLEPVLAHNDDVERVAREILIHAAMVAAICTIIVMVIP